jgi:hypothetical protein
LNEDRLKTFLYILLRDELPAGVLERIMRDHVSMVDERRHTYSNLFLADYAENLARRLIKE